MKDDSAKIWRCARYGIVSSTEVQEVTVINREFEI